MEQKLLRPIEWPYPPPKQALFPPNEHDTCHVYGLGDGLQGRIQGLSKGGRQSRSFFPEALRGQAPRRRVPSYVGLRSGPQTAGPSCVLYSTSQPGLHTTWAPAGASDDESWPSTQSVGSGGFPNGSSRPGFNTTSPARLSNDRPDRALNLGGLQLALGTYIHTAGPSRAFIWRAHIGGRRISFSGGQAQKGPSQAPGGPGVGYPKNRKTMRI